jgi:hypothetical protein
VSTEETSGGIGAFALFPVGEGTTLTSRHEAWALDPGASARWKSYHDLSLTDEAWTWTARASLDSLSGWTPEAEVRWAPLQDLSLYAASTLASPWVMRIGCLGTW